MTKYILNSGNAKNYPEKASLFFHEMIKGLGKEPRILSCAFAEKRENWEEKFETSKKYLTGLVDDSIKPRFEMALPEKFIEQVKNNDVIIISGGDDYLLSYWLSKYDLPKLWEGKVVAASSAGSDALATHFWTCDWRQCLDGLGVLPIKFIPHYKSSFGETDSRGKINWDKAYEDLKAYGDPSLPIYALEEGDFVVIEK